MKFFVAILMLLSFSANAGITQYNQGASNAYTAKPSSLRDDINTATLCTAYYSVVNKLENNFADEKLTNATSISMTYMYHFLLDKSNTSLDIANNKLQHSIHLMTSLHNGAIEQNRLKDHKNIYDEKCFNGLLSFNESYKGVNGIILFKKYTVHPKGDANSRHIILEYDIKNKSNPGKTVFVKTEYDPYKKSKVKNENKLKISNADKKFFYKGLMMCGGATKALIKKYNYNSAEYINNLKEYSAYSKKLGFLFDIDELKEIIDDTVDKAKQETASFNLKKEPEKSLLYMNYYKNIYNNCEQLKNDLKNKYIN